MRIAITLAAAALLAATTAEAADLTLLVGGSMQVPFRQVGTDFARQTGNKMKFVVDTTGALQKHLRSGEKADIILVSTQGMDQLEKEHLIQPGSRVDLAIADIGVSVRAGAPSPDLSSPEAFKRAMLSAKSISVVDPKAGGTSGMYLDGLFRRLGIAEEVSKKSVLRNQGSEVAEAVASGQAELGMTFISEMQPNKGVKIAGPLPAAIQSPTVYVVAIPAASDHKDEARAFIGAISNQYAWPAITAAGLTPIKKNS